MCLIHSQVAEHKNHRRAPGTEGKSVFPSPPKPAAVLMDHLFAIGEAEIPLHMNAPHQLYPPSSAGSKLIRNADY